jgi:hypothetical protein
MRCITLVAQPMPTTQVMVGAYCRVCWPKQDQQKPEFRAPLMNWVVVTDENSHRQLRACWRADRD